jgi:hypothetical protein
VDLNRAQFGNIGQADTLQGDLHRSAAEYARRNDLPEIRSDMSHVVMPHGAHLKLGERFNARPEWDSSEQAQASYDALEEGTWRQYDHLAKPKSKGGMGLHVNVVPYDAYGREDKSQPFADHWQNIIRDAKHDVAENGRIEALSTAATGGTPNFRNPETNDLFRAVHDVWGHIASNRGVDRQGEEGAFQHHRQLYPPVARPALANQLREQIGYMQRYGDFPKLKHAIGYDSGPMNPAQFGESYKELRAQADMKSREQGLL